MTSFIKGIEFFSDDLCYTRSHAREALIVSNREINILEKSGVYTLPRKKGCRFKIGEKIQFGKFAIVEQYALFLKGSFFFSMGSFSSSNSELPINTIVGRYSSIAHNVKRMYGNHPINRFTTSMLTYDKNVVAFQDYLDEQKKEMTVSPHGLPNASPLVIGNDVWIGQDVSFVSTGITVGDGAIIAAGSIVTKDVPPYTIVGGIPAKILKYRFPKEIIEKLLYLKWWKYGYADFFNIKPDDPIDIFINKLEKLIDKGDIKKFAPKKIKIENFY